MYGHIYRMSEAVWKGPEKSKAPKSACTKWPNYTEEALERWRQGGARAAFGTFPIATPGNLPKPTPLSSVRQPDRQHVRADAQLSGPDRALWANGLWLVRSAAFHVHRQPARGQETTITSFHSTLLHHGMVIVGVRTARRLLNMAEITGGSPYGAGTLAGADGKRMPSENELAIARFQGRHVTQIAKKLAGG